MLQALIGQNPPLDDTYSDVRIFFFSCYFYVTDNELKITKIITP